MKITLHCYIINYYLTQWTDNRMPDKRGTDNRGSTVYTKQIKHKINIRLTYAYQPAQYCIPVDVVSKMIVRLRYVIR